VKLPDEGEECLLMPHVPPGSLITQAVYGPIVFSNGAWVDLFRTPEAGEMIHRSQVALWTPRGPIAPADQDDAA
jgi:hypothetical protein